jgi:hypothetical protein
MLYPRIPLDCELLSRLLLDGLLLSGVKLDVGQFSHVFLGFIFILRNYLLFIIYTLIVKMPTPHAPIGQIGEDSSFLIGCIANTSPCSL